MHDHIVRYNLSLLDNRHRLEPDLMEEELAAIGYVTAQWAQLEHDILASTLVLSYKNETPPPKETTSLAFEKRLGAWRATIERFVTDKKEKARLLKLVSKAANLSAFRHKLAHGLWTWDYTDPKTLRASSFRPNVQFEADFNAEGIRRLGERIGELSFELCCPGGKMDAYQSMASLPAKDVARAGRHCSSLVEIRSALAVVPCKVGRPSASRHAEFLAATPPQPVGFLRHDGRLPLNMLYGMHPANDL